MGIRRVNQDLHCKYTIYLNSLLLSCFKTRLCCNCEGLINLWATKSLILVARLFLQKAS